MSKVSFRGEPIPEIVKRNNFQVADSESVINKIVSDNNREVTIEAVNFADDSYRLANVKLTTGDVVPVETAIALAQHNYLKGYTTGSTMRGGKTLRSVPSTDDNNPDAKRIYALPRF